MAFGLGAGFLGPNGQVDPSRMQGMGGGMAQGDPRMQQYQQMLQQMQQGRPPQSGYGPQMSGGGMPMPQQPGMGGMSDQLAQMRSQMMPPGAGGPMPQGPMPQGPQQPPIPAHVQAAMAGQSFDPGGTPQGANMGAWNPNARADSGDMGSMGGGINSTWAQGMGGGVGGGPQPVGPGGGPMPQGPGPQGFSVDRGIPGNGAGPQAPGGAPGGPQAPGGGGAIPAWMAARGITDPAQAQAIRQRRMAAAGMTPGGTPPSGPPFAQGAAGVGGGPQPVGPGGNSIVPRPMGPQSPNQSVGGSLPGNGGGPQSPMGQGRPQGPPGFSGGMPRPQVPPGGGMPPGLGRLEPMGPSGRPIDPGGQVGVLPRPRPRPIDPGGQVGIPPQGRPYGNDGQVGGVPPRVAGGNKPGQGSPPTQVPAPPSPEKIRGGGPAGNSESPMTREAKKKPLKPRLKPIK